jgi:hypothetical protein
MILCQQQLTRPLVQSSHHQQLRKEIFPVQTEPFGELQEYLRILVGDEKSQLTLEFG